VITIDPAQLIASVELGKVEDIFAKIDLPALKRMVESNAAVITRIPEDERPFFEHLLARQQLLLFVLIEWKALMARQPKTDVRPPIARVAEAKGDAP
jgi:hypothetical protein